MPFPSGKEAHEGPMRLKESRCRQSPNQYMILMWKFSRMVVRPVMLINSLVHAFNEWTSSHTCLVPIFYRNRMMMITMISTLINKT